MDNNNRFVKMMENYVNMLERENDDLKSETLPLIKEVEELKAENKTLKQNNHYKKNLTIEIEELKDKLQAVNDDYNNDHKVHNEYEDGLLKEIEELKAEVKRGEEQYHMLASSKSKGIPKEYKAEAEEYFEHNNHCQEVMFFMLDNTLFDDNDDFDDFINKDDAICVINNKEVIA